MTSRTTRIHEVAEIIGRYRPVQSPAGWAVVNLDTSEVVRTAGVDEITARAAARLAAAGDIVTLFEGDKP